MMTIFRSLMMLIWKALSIPGSMRGECVPGLLMDREYRPSSAPRRTSCKIKGQEESRNRVGAINKTIIEIDVKNKNINVSF